ncbi:c-type cytochrome [Cupriavidus sp. AU9028]|uniref:c-type cytochrome n=1 Tax=Cupriavidus sp. AU9028 TaxID=2871157 RepID=UPI001C961D8E|nr:c-type cytochrome [Cupriavidus sp. AU9028]MBY4897914.1 c-type cytochrome [Cupriavidus sp. AU9028]
MKTTPDSTPGAGEPHADAPPSRVSATYFVTALVLIAGAAPIVGVLYQMWPDIVGPRPVAQDEAEGPRTATAALKQAPPASAPIAAASEPETRQSTDFMPREPDWSRMVRTSGEQAPQRGATIAANGNGAGAAACVSCHAGGAPAAAGQAAPAAPANAGAFPALVGLSADYLAKQLVDYREGRRNDPIMTPIARALSEEDIAAVSRHYGELPAPALTLAEGTASPALKLHAEGDNARALPACANCHGVSGEGQGFLLPRLTGQPADYLVRQLAAFRNGTRHNDQDAAMRAIAQRLGEADSQALAQFYATGGSR